MFRSFELHSRIFHQQNLHDYFMISSGTNQFPMPSIWKESLSMEINSDFLYRWYTSSSGFQCITSAVKTYEDFASACDEGSLPRSSRRVCMTVGGSGAASLAFEYLDTVYHDCSVILVGMNYSLYERLSKKHHFSCTELCGEQDGYALPEPNVFRALKGDSGKYVFVFSFPNNPTGESYDKETFAEILAAIRTLNGFIILDMVCDIVISQEAPFLPRRLITQEGLWDSCVVVNSFSKSDAVAGLRIGYLYGTEELIRFCAAVNASTIMNPPTFPAFAIVVTCLFRCIYLNRRIGGTFQTDQKLIRLFHRLFLLTSAVIPDKMLRYTDGVFDHVEELYQGYVASQLRNEQIMRSNAACTIETFSPHILRVSPMAYGFNFCVWFRHKMRMDELMLIRSLLEHTGVAVLTESSFTIRKVDQTNYMIRFSTACDETLYSKALQRMAAYMEKETFIL